MTYEETIRSLFSVMATCNVSDHETRQSWQHADDCHDSSDPARRGAYGHVRAALIALAGEPIVDHWEATQEIELDLADRTHPQDIADRAVGLLF